MSEEAVVERYSFSKLSSFHTCPYGYKLRYIDGKKGIGNAFASYGSFVHQIMEDYANGKNDLWSLVDVFEFGFDVAIPEEFPPNKYVDLRESYFNQGIDFFNRFEGYDDYTIIGAEEPFSLKIDDWEFIGIVDLIYRDDEGKLVCRDYKSKKSFANKEEKKKYARQLYLYSLYIKEKYGQYPDRLEFLMFRTNTVVPIDFDPEALDEALTWAKDTVKEIRQAWDYPPSCDDFYGNHLCNHREYCEFKAKELAKSKYKKNYKKTPK